MSQTANTPYGPVSQAALEAARRIRLLICDVDGVLSDGKIYLGNNGEELKSFHTKDGFGLKAVMAQGVEVAVITGRSSRIVSDRMLSLGVRHVYQGQGDKLPVYQQLLQKLDLTADQVAYIGDDVIDLPVMRACGLGVAVADAHPLVQQGADFICRLKGGEGAVRELCDLLLQALGALESAQGPSV